MKDVLKWIGVVLIGNFINILWIPFLWLAVEINIKKEFWQFAIALVGCYFIGRPLYTMFGKFLGSQIKLNTNQSIGLAVISVVSVLWFLISLDFRTANILQTVFLGGTSMYLFLMSFLMEAE